MEEVKQNSSSDHFSEQQQDEEQDHHEEYDEQNEPKGQSIYETFMDVSSIFSNPMMLFGAQAQARKERSRFFNDVGESSEEEPNQRGGD